MYCFSVPTTLICGYLDPQGKMYCVGLGGLGSGATKFKVWGSKVASLRLGHHSPTALEPLTGPET